MISLVEPRTVDNIGELWGAIRDTVRRSNCSYAEKLGALELVRHELTKEAYEHIEPSL